MNEKIDLSFATVLRSVLRQDPDVILVGEMRDTETAQIGLRAAITGHMVLSTLHTRSAAAAPSRMLDMGVPRFMVATALQAVIAQRLVRLVCESCAEDYVPTPQEARFAEATGLATGALKRGRGSRAPSRARTSPSSWPRRRRTWPAIRSCAMPPSSSPPAALP